MRIRSNLSPRPPWRRLKDYSGNVVVKLRQGVSHCKPSDPILILGMQEYSLYVNDHTQYGKVPVVNLRNGTIANLDGSRECLEIEAEVHTSP